MEQMTSIHHPIRFVKIIVNKMKNLGNEIYFNPIKNVGHALRNSGRFWEVSTKAKKNSF